MKTKNEGETKQGYAEFERRIKSIVVETLKRKAVGFITIRINGVDGTCDISENIFGGENENEN